MGMEMNIPSLLGCQGTGETGLWISLGCKVRGRVPNTCMHISLQLGGTGRVYEGKEQISLRIQILLH